MGLKQRLAAGIVMSAAVFSGVDRAAAADAIEDFYKGKTISAIVPFGPGGGYAIYNQIMARHLPKFIPGQPQIVPQHMPGAGGIVAHPAAQQRCFTQRPLVAGS